MLKQYTPSLALENILKRTPLEDMPITQRMQEGIRKLFGKSLTPVQVVDQILKDVRKRGDDALLDWTFKLDGVRLESLQISATQIQAATADLDLVLRNALDLSIERIRKFHQSQPVNSWITQDLGGRLGQLIRPIQRVGLYIPAGSAPLPSSIIMSAVPAQVAGVREIVLVSPPATDTGEIAPVILAVANLLGINEIYPLGGAQAIAALAYGTQTIRPVDKIFGPGNLFVTLAKKQVFGSVGIDSLAGPTETVVIADDSAKPAWVAADLLAQAEHDVLAAAILLTPSQSLIQAVQAEIETQLTVRKRANVIHESLAHRSGAVLTLDLNEAIQLANQYAPEHLCLSVENPWELSEKVNCAGGIFIGENSCEVLGDYVAGPSHVMPTGGSARFGSPLNVLDFVHIVSLVALNTRTARQIAPSAEAIARVEGLDAHAFAASLRAGKEIRLKPSRRFDDFPAYTPIEPFDVLAERLGIPVEKIIKLDANENPYGLSPKAVQALQNVKDANIYPDPENRALRVALASYTGMPMKNILAGAGADELIDLILRVMIEPGDAVMSFPPTFGMYAFDARLNGANLVEISRRDDFSLDVPAVMEKARSVQPKLIFLTSPNNPDGRMLSDEEFEAVISLPCLVVLDEAYIEFSGAQLGKANSHMGKVLQCENLVVLRTFSKWAGLAGLRIGYGAFPDWLMPVLWKAKQPYNVNVAASQAAIASLADLPYLQDNVTRIIAERTRLQKALQEIPFLTPSPSSTNFMLCKVTGRSARTLQRQLMKEGILVRFYENTLMKDYIRISVGRPQDTERLVEALQNVDLDKG